MSCSFISQPTILSFGTLILLVLGRAMLQPVKIFPEMTCYVSGGTYLILTHSLTHWLSADTAQLCSCAMRLTLRRDTLVATKHGRY